MYSYKKESLTAPVLPYFEICTTFERNEASHIRPLAGVEISSKSSDRRVLLKLTRRS